MNSIKKIVFPAFIIAVSLFCTAFFRVIPASKLWNGYSVMYVQKDADQNKVYKALYESGINNFISLFNQKIPLANSIFSAEYALSTLSFSNYLEERKGYFFDSSKQFFVYYIPDNYETELRHVIQQLNQDGINSGVNANASYPWISFVLCLAFALFLSWKSEKKILSVTLNAIPVFFTFVMPFYTVAVSQCLLMTVFFFGTQFWKRNGAVSVLSKNKTFIILFSFSFFLLIFTNIRVTLFFILSLVSSVCVLIIFQELYEIYDKRYDFKPVLIRPAAFIKPINHQNRKIFFYCSIVSVLIMLSALVSVKALNFSSSGENIMLPAKNSAKKTLPGLNDYVLWNWNAVTFPYRSLNDGNPNELKTSVVFPRYEQKDGLVTESFNSIEFDEKFRQNVINSIDALEYESIESMLKKQGTSGRTGYSSSGSSAINFFSFILLFAGALISALFYFVYSAERIKKQEKKS